MRVKLSKAALANAKPGPTRYLLRDTRTVGLALKVEPSGTRTFVFEYRYRFPGKPSQRYIIGRYGEPWTLDQARAEAGRLRSLIDRGLDPVAGRRREMPVGRTIADLAERHLAHVEKAGRRASTVANYRRILGKLVLPRLGRMRVADLQVEQSTRLTGASKRRPLRRVATSTRRPFRQPRCPPNRTLAAALTPIEVGVECS